MKFDFFRLLSILFIVGVSFLSLTSTGFSKADHLLIYGNVLSPEKYLPSSKVLIRDNTILAVDNFTPEFEIMDQIIVSENLISPGFIDSHNHVLYNFIPFWNAPKLFNNRYQWARTKEYRAWVRTPYNLLKGLKLASEKCKYGEIKALISGTTSIQGTVNRRETRILLRNIEYFMRLPVDSFVAQHGLAVSGIKDARAERLLKQYESGKYRAFLVHLAEGVDDSSRREFDQIKEKGLLTKELGIIHGTALQREHFEEIAEVGASLIWSPRSNIVLYGQTTDIPTALELGIKVALAPDWNPSGSPNILEEIRYAYNYSNEHWEGLLTPRDLVLMTTSIPAEILGYHEYLGRIAPGLRADLVMIKQPAEQTIEDPYELILNAKLPQIMLVLIDGDPLYGERENLEFLGKTDDYELLDVQGFIKALDTTAEGSNIPASDQRFKDIEGIIKNLYPETDPLDEGVRLISPQELL